MGLKHSLVHQWKERTVHQPTPVWLAYLEEEEKEEEEEEEEEEMKYYSTEYWTKQIV